MPSNLTASALNSTAIRVTWNKPNPPSKFGDQYLLSIYNETYERSYQVRSTAETITGLTPSSIYNVTVQAFLTNGTLVRATAFTSVQTLACEGQMPSNLTASALNSTAIRVTWNKPNPPSKFGDQYLLSIYNETYERSYQVRSTAETITGLTPSSIYNVTVQAFLTNGTLVRATAFTSVQTLACEGQMPSNLTASALNSTAIRVTWNKPNPPSKFGDQYLLSIYNETYERSYQVRSTAETITGLTPSSIYNVTVQAFLTNGTLVRATAFTSVQTLACEGQMPSNLTASALNSTAIRVTWNKPNPPSKFGDQYLLSIYNETYERSYQVRSTAETITGLTPSSIYNVTVQAFLTNGTLVRATAFTSVQTLACEGQMPSNLTASALNSTAIRVTWNKPNPPSKFGDQYLLSIYNETYERSYQVRSTAETITGLTPSSIYNVTVQAFLTNGTLVRATAFTSVQTLACEGQMPSNLTASALNSTAIRVTWNKPNPPSKFGDQYLLSIYNETYERSYQVRSTAETITGLTPSSIYNVTVQAFLTNGTLVRATAFTSVQTLACEGQMPSNLTASALNSTAIRVTWNKPNPPSKFGDQYLLSIYNETYERSYQVRSTAETITGLTPSSIYNVTVQAFLTNGTLVRATAFTSVQTLACEGQMPSNLTASALNSTAIRVTWNKPNPPSKFGDQYLLSIYNETYERSYQVRSTAETITGLTPSSIYNVTVQAFLTNGTLVRATAFTSVQTLACEGQMPSNLTASALNSTAIRVTWNKPNPPSKFGDQYLLSIYNETYERSYQVRSTAETITGLTPSSIYNVTVQAFLTNGTLVRATAFTSVQTLACEGQMPSNLTASALNSTAIRVTWNKPNPPSKFGDQYLLSIYNETYERSYQVRSTAETITGLTPSSIYNVTVQAFLTNGTLVRATAFTSVQTLACEGQMPSNLTASALNSTAIRVTWNKPNPPSKFGDQYLLSIYNETYERSYQVRSTAETITGLTPSSIYNVTVQAFLTNGTLVRATAFTSVQTLACEGQMPSNLTASALNSTAIRVTWNKPNPPSKFGDQYLLSIYNETYERSYQVRSTAETITGLTPSSIYNVTVQAFLTNGTLVRATAFTSVQTLACEGQMPSNLTASALNSTAIRVTWNKPNPPSKFGDQYLLSIYNETYERSYQVRSTAETITGLTPSSIYNVTVQAFLTNGTLVRATAFTSVQTLACEGQMPSNLTASALNSTAIRVTWNKPNPPSKFGDQYLLSIYNETYERSYQVRSTAETITGLTPSSIYNVTVQAFLTNGTLVRATAFTSVQTLACEGQMPSNLTASALNSTAIRVTWNKPNPPSKFGDQYLLSIYNETYERSYQVRSTAETITGLTPSSIYNVTVQAFLTNGTLVRATAFTSVQTLACGNWQLLLLPHVCKSFRASTF
ncbi:hypothetical protein SprV_0802648800 [Sparganum proliferum]